MYLRSTFLCTVDYFAEKMIKKKKKKKKSFIDAFYSPNGPFSYELLFPSFYVALIQPRS